MPEDFMAAMVNKSQRAQPHEKLTPPKTGNECTDCNGTNVVASAAEGGGEQANRAVGADSLIGQAHGTAGSTTIAMRAPLGALFTEALNKYQTRTIVPDNVQIGNEDVYAETKTVVSANGQTLNVRNREQSAFRTRLMTGMLPIYGETPTALNAFLQAAGSVKSVDVVFALVSDQMADCSVQTGKPTPTYHESNQSHIETVVIEQGAKPIGTVIEKSPQPPRYRTENRHVAMEDMEIDGVELVIRYRKK